MRSPGLAALELRRFGGGRLPRAALVALLVPPLLYGALYLWSFWDPYGRLDRVPVALVDEVQGVTAGGRKITAGADIVRGLRERRTFEWHEVAVRGGDLTTMRQNLTTLRAQADALAERAPHLHQDVADAVARIDRLNEGASAAAAGARKLHTGLGTARSGSAGRILVLALLMLQLTSAAGTYPVQTSPGFFNAIHPCLPMSHVVSALRRLISGGGLGPVWQACVVLTAFTAGALALTALTARRRQVWTLQRLHPELSL
ncbi:YhgE/Pip family protein [Streptomyces sp. NPDC058459]|uniref:YhgE/Pip family protein n=1 Tax=Streptomyces sp. NPDC058459 TaxID=3346508 RepID=UPI0036566B82